MHRDRDPAGITIYLTNRLGSARMLHQNPEVTTDMKWLGLRHNQVELRYSNVDQVKLRYSNVDQVKLRYSNVDQVELRYNQVELRYSQVELRYSQVELRYNQVDRYVV